MSTSSLLTVLIEQPAMRVVARRLFPSTSIDRICARFSVESLFILNIIRDRSSIIKRESGIR